MFARLREKTKTKTKTKTKQKTKNKTKQKKNTSSPLESYCFMCLHDSHLLIQMLNKLCKCAHVERFEIWVKKKQFMVKKNIVFGMYQHDQSLLYMLYADFSFFDSY